MVEHRHWSTTVRLTEMDDTGLVQPHRILEWMQEGAASASTQAGYSPERYRTMKAAWFIREVRIAIDGPVIYGEKIDVETWISSLRRFRSWREYVIRAEGRVIARGQAEWLFLDLAANGRIRPRIPDPVMAAAFPRDPTVAIPSEELPPLSSVDAAPEHTDRRIIRPSEIDANGHVNNVRYLAWLDDQGRSYRPDHQMVFARLEYLLDAKPGDEVRLLLHAAEGIDHQRILRGDELVMRASVRRKAG